MRDSSGASGDGPGEEPEDATRTSPDPATREPTDAPDAGRHVRRLPRGGLVRRGTLTDVNPTPPRGLRLGTPLPAGPADADGEGDLPGSLIITSAELEAEPDRSVARRRSTADLAWGWGSLAVYFVLAVLVFWNVWAAHPTTTTVGGPDSDLVSWLLAYSGEALAHLHNPFFTTYANFPYGLNLLTNAGSPLLGVVGAPITVTLGGVATFNVMTTASLATAAGSGYLLVRRFTDWHPAAFVGGLLFGFSPYEIVQATDAHLQMAFTALVPLIFLVLHDICVHRPDRWVRNGLALAVLCVAQFFISSEVLVTAAIVAAVALVAAAVAARASLRERLRRLAPSLGVGLGGTAAVLAYPAWYALRGPAHVSGPIMPVAEAFRGDLAGFVLPDTSLRFNTGGHLLSIAQSFAHGGGENTTYLGIGLIVVLVATVVWLRREAQVWVVAVAGLAAAVLSLGGALALDTAPPINASSDASGGLPLPEAILHKIGPLESIIPARFSLYTFLAAAVLLGMVVDRCWATWSGRRPGAPADEGRRARRRARSRLRAVAAGTGALAVAAVALVPLVPYAPVGPAVFNGIPDWFAAAVHPKTPHGSVVLTYPYASGQAPQVESWLSVAGVPFQIPGGYFLAPGPTGQEVTGSQLNYTRDTAIGDWLYAIQEGHPNPHTAAWRLELDDELRSWGVRTVVAVPADGADPSGALSQLEWLLGKPSAQTAETAEWYHVATRLRSAAAPTSAG